VADQTPNTNAHQRVVETVRAIPEGFVRTYGSLAQGGRQRALLDAEGIPFWPPPHRGSIYASAGFRTTPRTAEGDG
jgi:hypothetical protein